jgi:hypothetical protein
MRFNSDCARELIAAEEAEMNESPRVIYPIPDL